MSLTQLNAISPIDGRYRNKITKLANYFSEEALIKYRVRVEIEYFIALCEIPLPQLVRFNIALFDKLRKIYIDFSAADAQKIKDIEKVNENIERNLRKSRGLEEGKEDFPQKTRSELCVSG